MPLPFSQAKAVLCIVSLLCSTALCRAQSIAVPWGGYGHDAQHTGISVVAAQTMSALHWPVPVEVDEVPQYSGTSLLIHYERDPQLLELIRSRVAEGCLRFATNDNNNKKTDFLLFNVDMASQK